MTLVKETQSRVYENTSRRSNERIHNRLQEIVIHYAGNPGSIDNRLRKLDREWDIERILETNVSSLVMLFLILGYFITPWLFILPGLIGFFFLLHAIQGWCPPIPLLRRWGIRTTKEINQERCALKALRGDFAGLEDNTLDPKLRAMAALKAAE